MTQHTLRRVRPDSLTPTAICEYTNYPHRAPVPVVRHTSCIMVENASFTTVCYGRQRKLTQESGRTVFYYLAQSKISPKNRKLSVTTFGAKSATMVELNIRQKQTIRYRHPPMRGIQITSLLLFFWAENFNDFLCSAQVHRLRWCKTD